MRETWNLFDYMHGNDLAAFRPEPSGNLHGPEAMPLVQSQWYKYLAVRFLSSTLGGLCINECFHLAV